MTLASGMQAYDWMILSHIWCYVKMPDCSGTNHVAGHHDAKFSMPRQPPCRIVHIAMLSQHRAKLLLLFGACAPVCQQHPSVSFVVTATDVSVCRQAAMFTVIWFACSNSIRAGLIIGCEYSRVALWSALRFANWSTGTRSHVWSDKCCKLSTAG